VSNVAIAKTGMRADASGWSTEARTPVKLRSSGPSSCRRRQPASRSTSTGTASWSQTTDSSSAVRVIEENAPPAAHSGMAADGGSRQTA
jgi:hypothetical protein